MTKVRLIPVGWMLSVACWRLSCFRSKAEAQSAPLLGVSIEAPLLELLKVKKKKNHHHHHHHQNHSSLDARKKASFTSYKSQ